MLHLAIPITNSHNHHHKFHASKTWSLADIEHYSNVKGAAFTRLVLRYSNRTIEQSLYPNRAVRHIKLHSNYWYQYMYQ